MLGPMMWFKREPKDKENGVVGKLRRKKQLLKPTRESSERETSTESDKERRRYSDILDMKVSLERRDESDESLYESADGHSDAISASDDALSRLGKTPTMSKESLKLAITDEEVDLAKNKKGHRKTMSLSNPLEIVKNLGDEWFEAAKKELDKTSDKRKSRESLLGVDDKESLHGSNVKLDQTRKSSKKEDKSNSSSRKSSTVDAPKARKPSKASSVSALNFLRRKKTPTSVKPVEVVNEDVVDTFVVLNTDEVLRCTKFFLEEEKRLSSNSCERKPVVETDTDDEPPTPKIIGEHRRRLSRQTSRNKSKVRGKSQSVKVNTLRKSHSGTLKKAKKKGVKGPAGSRSRQASVVELTPMVKKKNSDATKQNSWLFSSKDSKREGSADDAAAADGDADNDAPTKDVPEKDTTRRGGSNRVNRAESCRERDAPRRGKHRNASDPNRLAAHHALDLEPGAATAPSGSSSSSSLSSRSNESNTVAADQQASQSDVSDEDEPLAAQWADSLPPHLLDSLLLSARLRKRQEVIHELIVSEGSHVRWLKVLGSVFLRPLETQTSLLPADELRALFPNLPSVRDRHARLYAELRTARTEATDHVLAIKPVADAMLNMLGEANYATCLARFCRGQRMALEALRERRRKNKDLHQFLASREQLPLCGRLQLRDLLACVWQRLTKYQLLLESILKTTDEEDSEADVALLARALDTAKRVLHSVDTSIRTAENEHRLRTIQSKLEVRAHGAEWDELRRLELTARALRLEGDLAVRHDGNKKITVLALMLEDSLVLLQREGDRFILKPIPQPSLGSHLSPLIKWDKVLFRPNAAVRNTFFLMNINGVQMHELSANTAQEYATWVKHIQEAPLVRYETKPAPSHAHTRSTDDSGINVSRNPSDASEKSNASVTEESAVIERDNTSAERDRSEPERDRSEPERDKSTDVDDKDDDKREEKLVEREERHKPRRPTLGRISTHARSPPPALLPPAALTVTAPAAAAAHTAEPVCTPHERLRRLDAQISASMRAKAGVVAELLGVPLDSFAQVADLAVADALGDFDVRRELKAARLDRSSSVEEDGPPTPPAPPVPTSSPPSAPLACPPGTPPSLPSLLPAAPLGTSPPGSPPPVDMHQLLLAAQTQANQLTELVSAALSVSEAGAVRARARGAGRCDSCRVRREPRRRRTDDPLPPPPPEPADTRPEGESIERDISFDMLAELDNSDNSFDTEAEGSAALLACRVSGAVCGLQATLSRALAALPEHDRRAHRRRAHHAAARDRRDAALYKMCVAATPTDAAPVTPDAMQEQPSNGG